MILIAALQWRALYALNLHIFFPQTLHIKKKTNVVPTETRGFHWTIYLQYMNWWDLSYILTKRWSYQQNQTSNQSHLFLFHGATLSKNTYIQDGTRVGWQKISMGQLRATEAIFLAAIVPMKGIPCPFQTTLSELAMDHHSILTWDKENLLLSFRKDTGILASSIWNLWHTNWNHGTEANG